MGFLHEHPVWGVSGTSSFQHRNPLFWNTQGPALTGHCPIKKISLQFFDGASASRFSMGAVLVIDGIEHSHPTTYKIDVQSWCLRI
jgi:hypothetical protein